MVKRGKTNIRLPHIINGDIFLNIKKMIERISNTTNVWVIITLLHLLCKIPVLFWTYFEPVWLMYIEFSYVLVMNILCVSFVYFFLLRSLLNFKTKLWNQTKLLKSIKGPLNQTKLYNIIIFSFIELNITSSHTTTINQCNFCLKSTHKTTFSLHKTDKILIGDLSTFLFLLNLFLLRYTCIYIIY